jgi:hypothetical protein
MLDSIFNILLYCKVKDIVNICLCNKTCLTLLTNQHFWVSKYHIEQLPILGFDEKTLLSSSSARNLGFDEKTRVSSPSARNLDTLNIKNYYRTKYAVLTVEHVINNYRMDNIHLSFDHDIEKVFALLPNKFIIKTYNN